MKELTGKIALSLALLFLVLPAQASDQSGDRLLEIAREVIAASGTCVLITLDPEGRPHARTMDPFEPEDGLVVWLGTNRLSRKVEEIRKDPRVTLYYFDADSPGYATITGTARLVEESEELERRWKPAWSAFYPDRESTYLLIEVTPLRLEVISVRHGLEGDPETWTPPSVTFE